MAAKKRTAEAATRVRRVTQAAPTAPQKPGQKVTRFSKSAAAAIPTPLAKQEQKATPSVVSRARVDAALPRRKAPATRVLSSKTPVPAASRSKTASTQAHSDETRALAEGDRAPSFKLVDQRGGPVASESLAGRAYVLYFYPKNDTPGCTVEACDFRDASKNFEKAGVPVLGVSPDSTASHQKFSAKYALPFTLLSDADQQLASAYGVWALKKNYGREYMGVVRSTFLVGPDGMIRKVWRGVRVKGHVAEVEAAARSIR